MRLLSNVWRSWRQSDRFKLRLLLILLAGYLIFSSAAQAVNFFRLMDQPAEYIVTGSFPGAVPEASLDRLRALPGVVGVSRQREYTLTCGSGAVTVTELERSYLTDCFGISDLTAERCYWLSPQAFKAFLGSDAVSPARAVCRKGEREISGRFICWEGLTGADQAVAVGQTVTLRDAVTLRVMFEKDDLTDTAAQRLGAMGFSVLNTEDLLRRSYETRLLQAKLGYSGLAAVLALLGARLLKKSRV